MMIKETIKNTLRKIPLVQQIYTRFVSFQYSNEGRKLFTNYDLFFKALNKKEIGSVVLFTRDGLKLTIRQNIWDARIIQETFIEKPYIRYFNLPSNPTIVDIGGYIGDFSIYAAKYLNANVIVYEPTIENFVILKQNIENNGFEKRIIPINKAVSDSNEIKLNIKIQKSEEVHASAYMYQDAGSRIIPSITLSNLLETHQLDSIDLLKVDCEGCEYDIFSETSDQIFNRIKNIVFEYHRVEGFKMKLDLVLNRLQSIGYRVKIDGQIAYAYRKNDKTAEEFL